MMKTWMNRRKKNSSAQRRSTPDWKHPDDGKELSDRDQEIPLKP